MSAYYLWPLRIQPTTYNVYTSALYVIGIRCVKINAFLTQVGGFTNVSRLAGGVVAYDRTLNEKAPAQEESMFKGVNYVFDGRMGRRITDDQLGTCYTCGRKTHLVSNCKNDNCHRRMVQCEYCTDSFFGTCSEGCKVRVVNSRMMSKRNLVVETSPSEMIDEEIKDGYEEHGDDTSYSNLDEYSSAHSTKCSPLMSEIEANTVKFFPSGSHMISGSMQGALLTTLASMSREGRILEIVSTECPLLLLDHLDDINFTHRFLYREPLLATQQLASWRVLQPQASVWVLIPLVLVTAVHLSCL